jgi:hypothetical protein
VIFSVGYRLVRADSAQFLIRDRAGQFTDAFDAVFTGQGIQILISPPQAPKAKARVERPMPYVRDSFWRGREFTSLAQMQAEAERWSAEVPGSGRAGRWTAPRRPPCSRRWRSRRCGRCPASRSCWLPGPGRRSARTSTRRPHRDHDRQLK